MLFKAQKRLLPMTFITPAPFPMVTNAQPNLQVTLSNQLALQLAKLFQDLFPINQDYREEASTITDPSTLEGRVNLLLEDIGNIKMTILTINQITTLAASRIPAGYTPGGPNADPTNIAGLDTSSNPNAVLNTLNLLYDDITDLAFASAQSDYATLRGQLQPYFGL